MRDGQANETSKRRRWEKAYLARAEQMPEAWEPNARAGTRAGGRAGPHVTIIATMTPHPVIRDAVESLCSRFEEGGYALTPIIDLGTLVVNADGAVDDGELEMLRYLYHALLGSQFSPDTLQHLVRSSSQVVSEAGIEARARLIAEILLDCDAVEEGLTVALGVAFASDGLADSERALIASIASAAAVSAGDLDVLIERVRSTVAAS